MYFFNMAVKTWTELAEGLRDKIFQSIEDGSWRTLAVTNVDGVSQTFQSIQEMMDFLDSVEAKAQAEEDAKIRSPYRPIRLRSVSSSR